MAQPMIQLKNVSKKFAEVEAVKNLSLSVEKGQIYGFLGPNGAGKSTTIRMLTGIFQPDHGSILIGGKSLEDHPEEIKRRIAYIPDDPFVYRYLTGREFLFFIASVYGLSTKERDQKIAHIIKLFPTIDQIDAPFYTFSRGTRQKLVFMAALLHEPDLFIIDEPMVGLDPQSVKVVKDILIDAVKTRGATVFVCTHTLAVAEEICDRVAIIAHGKLVAEGTLHDLQHLSGHHHAHLEELFLALT